MIDQSWLQTRTPSCCQNTPKRLFDNCCWCYVSHVMCGIPKINFWCPLGLVVMPQGSILESCWVTWCPLKAQIWGHVVPMFAAFVSARVKQFFYTSLRPPMPKTFKHVFPTRLSKNNFHITGGWRYREAFYDTRYQSPIA